MADQTFHLAGEEGNEIRLNAKGTVGSFGGRKFIYNKIITRKIYGPPPPPYIRLCICLMLPRSIFTETSLVSILRTIISLSFNLDLSTDTEHDKVPHLRLWSLVPSIGSHHSNRGGPSLAFVLVSLGWAVSENTINVFTLIEGAVHTKYVSFLSK